MLLKDKTVIITGSGSGVGRASALLFAQEGAKVVCADVKHEWVKDTVRMIEEAGGTGIAVECDVTKEQDVIDAVSTAVDTYGRLDILFNNAGVATPRPGAKLEDHTFEDWERLMAINFRGVFFGCKYAVIQFKKQGDGGVIVNTGSVAGMVGFGGVPYGVSKAGGVLLTKSLAMEVAKEGIRINAIAPATLLTNFGRSDEEAFTDRSQAEIDLWGSYVPTGRASTPEDCAQAILFLASDMSANTTGAIVPVDGGYLAR